MPGFEDLIDFNRAQHWLEIELNWKVIFGMPTMRKGCDVPSLLYLGNI